MKKEVKNLILSILFLSAIFSISYLVIAITVSSPPINVWNSTIDGPQNGFDVGNGIALDNESNIYITGSSRWSNDSTYDIYIGKFDSAGNNIWNTTLDGLLNSHDASYAIALDSEYNIYVTGYSIWEGSTSYSDLYIGKFDSAGNNIWNTTFNGLANVSDHGYAIALDNESNVYVTGDTYTNSSIYPDLYLGKFNSTTGNIIWNVTFEGLFPYEDYGYGIVLDNNSNIYITGSTYWSTDTCYDIYVGKFNSTTGNNIWNSTIAGPQDYCDSGFGIVLDNESNVYITGMAYWSSVDYSDIYVGKFNSTTGVNIWNSTISTFGQNDDSGNGITFYNNSVYITGQIEPDFLGSDIYIGKFNSTTGTNTWNFTFNGEQEDADSGSGIAVRNESDIYVTGNSEWSSATTTDIYLGRFSEILLEEDCTESWTCTDWNITCSNEAQTRTCTDANACGTVADKPAESQFCRETPTEGSGSGNSIIPRQNDSFQPKEEECIPNEKRCLSNQIQSCSESKNWIISETCEFGCENGQCISEKLGINPLILYPAIGVAVVGILASFLIPRIPSLKILFKK